MDFKDFGKEGRQEMLAQHHKKPVVSNDTTQVVLMVVILILAVIAFALFGPGLPTLFHPA